MAFAVRHTTSWRSIGTVSMRPVMRRLSGDERRAFD
jgi:hypothetical protein